jgi:hypothetical protein
LILFLGCAALVTLTTDFSLSLVLLSKHDVLELFRVLLYSDIELPLLLIELVFERV